MRAWRVHQLGDPVDVLTLEDIDVPTPGPGEVRIEVAACALNVPDMLLCQGRYQERPALPFTPGMEVAGTVSAVGDGVDRCRPGDRVLARPMIEHGGLAEQTLAVATDVFALSDAMGFEAASALHITYHTGHCALHRRARIRAGETLLVHAGAGGVGSAAIQLGKAAGARVIATAGGEHKVDVCTRLGADLAIDYSAGDFVDAVNEFTGGRGADVIYDPVGGDTFDRSRKCIAWEGRILVIGFTSGRIADAPTNHALIKNYSVVGVHWGRYARMEPGFDDAVHAELIELHAGGLVDPLVSEVLPMADAPAGLARLASRHTVGKIVIRPHG